MNRDRDELKALAERVEKASADEQIMMLREARGLAWPDASLADDAVLRQRNRFNRMIDVGAYESAALMLVPAGWCVGRMQEEWQTRRWHVMLSRRPSPAQARAFFAGCVIGVKSVATDEPGAATAAAAMTAAALRALAAQSDTERMG